MTFGQAVIYFLVEASRSLVRSWKVSFVAILTIATSLFMGGFVFLLSQNLSGAMEEWSSDLEVLVYLESEGEGSVRAGLRDLVERAPWVVDVTVVSAADAEERFRQTFPTLADLFAGWEEEPLPPSLEIRLEGGAVEAAELDAWLEQLRAHPGVSMVDDDRDWLRQLGGLLAVVRTAGLTLGLALLGAAIFTIAAVVKLTAYLYIDEIAVMRLVGATEFFIRGPFYSEGFLQGLLGGGLALGALHLSAGSFEPSEETVWFPYLLQEFLSWQQQLGLVVIGGLAGLFGAVISLRRESLKAETID